METIIKEDFRRTNLISRDKEHLTSKGYCSKVHECNMQPEQLCMGKFRTQDCLFFNRINSALRRHTAKVRGIILPIEKVEYPSKEIDLTLLSGDELYDLETRIKEERQGRIERVNQLEESVIFLQNRINKYQTSFDSKLSKHKEEDLFAYAKFQYIEESKVQSKISNTMARKQEATERIQSLTR